MELPPKQKQYLSRHRLAALLASMAESCLSMRDLKKIHAHAILTNTHHLPVVLGKIFRFAAVSPSGDLGYADKVFYQMPQPNAFFYNTLIRGYSKSSSPSRSVCLFNRMRMNCVDPNEFTFNFLLKARSRMEPLIMTSDEIHGVVLKFGFCSHLFVSNALIHLYASRGMPIEARRVFSEMVIVDVVSWSGLVVSHVKAGELEFARCVFDQMPERDVVSWTVMISGYSRAKRSREAFDLFWEMRDAGVRADEVTMVSIITACANLGDLEMGMAIHQYIDENGFGWMVSLCNALIGMYAKCGSMNRAWKLFNTMTLKSLVTWNSMILACANHGDANDAFDLFRHMTSSGIRPDGFTFLALLVAYAHKGMVGEGYRLFESMQRDYGTEARIEHYGCVVDMFGKAGLLEEAYRLIISMPIPSNDVIWRALLSACRIYGDLEMAERVVRRLLDLNPDGGGGYNFLLQEIYVAAGRIKEANAMRQTVTDECTRKPPGCSWIEA